MAVYTDLKTATSIAIDAEAINISIKNILLTRKGSMPGKPDFGSSISSSIFTQMDHITKNTLINSIEEALAKWEKRILVKNIVINEIPEYNKIVAVIEYHYREKGLFINEQVQVAFVQ